MKVAILAGGLGTRLAEETDTRPKALVRIGDRPVLWHIMRYYAHFGLREFVVALGYKGEMIVDYFTSEAGFRADAASNGSAVALRDPDDDGWRVELVDTGPDTQTGGRIKRLAPYLGDRTFMLTWCDGLADVDLDALLAFHRAHGRMATLTAAHPPPRFGLLTLDSDRVVAFREKAVDGNDWINGAFFVLEPGVFDYVAGDGIQWEREPLEGLSRDGELMAYRHEAFWQCMDTLNEARTLNAMWSTGAAPWKVWQ